MNTVDITKDAFMVSPSCDFTMNEPRFENLCHVMFVSSDSQCERHDNDY